MVLLSRSNVCVFIYECVFVRAVRVCLIMHVRCVHVGPGTFIYGCLYMRAFACVCLCVYFSVYICLCVCVCLYMLVCRCLNMCVCEHSCVNICARVWVDTCVFALMFVIRLEERE